MRSLFVLILSAAFGLGCVPAPTQQNTTPDYNAGAEYLANVSTMYSIGAVPTTGRVVDVQYKDSLGRIRALSADSGKALVITFWSTNSVNSTNEIAALDSIREIMGDSVRVFGIATDNTIHSFATVNSYISGNKRKLQVIVDSTLTATRLFSELTGDPNFYKPETFFVKPNMMVSDVLAGYFIMDTLLQRTRKAWK